ncbi:hypothetical protein B0H14DRAFT_2597399 [Mycena olivaceomarginata]|nr:hypothetical protein B0H14DRAFT_2597399 [Mycena olivaceomarginata]
MELNGGPFTKRSRARDEVVRGYTNPVTSIHRKIRYIEIKLGRRYPPRQVEKRIKMPPRCRTTIKAHAGRPRIPDSLSARQLMEFWDYISRRGVGLYSILISYAPNQLFSRSYIADNTVKFLDNDWVDSDILKEYVRCTLAAHAKIAPGADPLNEFMSSYGLSRHFDVTSDFSAFGRVDPLPLLPPPPPESPSASPAVEQLSEPGPSAPKSCRSRKEVDQTNILHLTRSRVPAARKRSVDEDVSSWLQKRGRRKQGRFRNSVSQSDHEFIGSIAPECPLENSVNFTQSGGKNIA